MVVGKVAVLRCELHDVLFRFIVANKERNNIDTFEYNEA